MDGDEAVTNGADALARMLQAHGAGPIFLPGGLGRDPLDRAIAGLGLTYAPIVDMRAACAAARAYAEASGRVGLVCAAPGTDLTEASGGLRAARDAGAPVIALLPEPSALEASVLAQVCKEVIRVEPAAAIPGLVRRAFIAATTGRPGPIALVVPAAVGIAREDFSPDDLVEHGRFEAASALRARPDAEALQEAVERLASAERPLVLAGPDIHVSRAAKALQDLAEARRIPVAHTPGGVGAVAAESEIAAGLLAPGTAAAAALEEADLVLAVGGALDEIARDAPALLRFAAPLVELEARAEAIGRVRPVTVPLWGDPRAGIEAIAHLLERAEVPVPEARETWAAAVAARREAERSAAAAERAASGSRDVEGLVAALSEIMPPDGLLVVEGRALARAATRSWEVKRCGRGLIVTPDDGTAFAAAIGAALATPGRVVVGLAGEAGAVRGLGALESARRLGLPVKLVVVAAAPEPDESAAPEVARTRFDAAARGLGCLGLSVDEAGELASSLEEALSFRDGPALVDVTLTGEPDLAET